MYNHILKKVKLKSAKIAVIGLGYVGLPLAVKLIKSNFDVYGFDNDKNKLEFLKKGKSYISTIKNNDCRYFKKFKNKLISKHIYLREVDVIIICLPTPLKKSKIPEMKYLENFSKNIKKNVKDGQIFILESTVFPGASEDFIKKIGIKKNLEKGLNFFIYSPERENPGQKNFSYKTTPKIISGYSEECIKLGSMIYSSFVKKIVKISSIKNAEASKLLENIFRSVNISFINEFKIICKNMGLNIYEIIDAAATKNFGFMKFLPGPGFGGHCIPIDPYYLSWISKKNGYLPKFIKTSGDINASMPTWIVKNIIKKFYENKIIFNNKKVLIVGVAYKKNVDDDRESPAFEIIKKLKKFKINVDYHDPYIKIIRKGRNFKNSEKLESIKLNPNQLKKYIATIIITDHDNINYKIIQKNSNLIFDTRGVFKNNYNNKIISL
jgi:UDP-N-acetyl-D-glucosamine dehydrogenase